jgi:hypothetical protein
VVALPDHPHLRRLLDEIEGFGGDEQLRWDAAGVGFPRARWWASLTALIRPFGGRNDAEAVF